MSLEQASCACLQEFPGRIVNPYDDRHTTPQDQVVHEAIDAWLHCFRYPPPPPEGGPPLSYAALRYRKRVVLKRELFPIFPSSGNGIKHSSNIMESVMLEYYPTISTVK